MQRLAIHFHLVWPLLEAFAADGQTETYEVPWYGKFFAGAAVLLFGWIGFRLWRGKPDWQITVRDGKVDFHGKFPQRQKADTAIFFLRELAPKHPLRIGGNWSGNRTLRVAIHGKLPMGDAQRIRNFLNMTMR